MRPGRPDMVWRSTAPAAEALAAVEAALPTDLAADFAPVRTNVQQFSDFIKQFVADAATPGVVTGRVDEIAERNNAVDDQLDALHRGEHHRHRQRRHSLGSIYAPTGPSRSPPSLFGVVRPYSFRVMPIDTERVHMST
jgi:hypothetical protein